MELALLGGQPIRTQPFPRWPIYGAEEERALLEVLRGASWGGYNEKVGELEKAFSALHRVRHAISCSNGTVAIEVALRALGLGCGEEVIVPPFTFVATATAVLICHGVPVFADIDPATLNLSPAAVEAAVSPRTRAIIAVHFGGHPADLDAITRIAERHNLALIEDAAHAHGAAWRGTTVGNFGLMATFSFQAFKLATGGEGGMVVTNSSDIAQKVWSYCNHGRSKGGKWFEHHTLGSNYRITGFQAAVLLAQLDRLPGQTRLREENVAYFRQQLKSLEGLSMGEDDERVSSNPHYLVTLRYDASRFAGLERDRFIQAVNAEGIPVEAAYPFPLYRNPLFRRTALPPCGCGEWRSAQDYESLFLPESERICREGLWLDHFLFLGTQKDVDDILAAFRKVQRLAPSLAEAGKQKPEVRS